MRQACSCPRAFALADPLPGMHFPDLDNHLSLVVWSSGFLWPPILKKLHHYFTRVYFSVLIVIYFSYLSNYLLVFSKIRDLGYLLNGCIPSVKNSAWHQPQYILNDKSTSRMCLWFLSPTVESGAAALTEHSAFHNLESRVINWMSCVDRSIPELFIAMSCAINFTENFILLLTHWEIVLVQLCNLCPSILKIPTCSWPWLFIPKFYQTKSQLFLLNGFRDWCHVEKWMVLGPFYLVL